MLFGIKRTKGYVETETIAEAVKKNDKNAGIHAKGRRLYFKDL